MEKIRVIISNRQKQIRVPTGVRMLIRRCCHAVLQLEGFPDPAEISVSFVDNDQIKEMNRQYRDKDSVTDVLSFPMGEGGNYDVNHETGARILGDIVISIPKAMEQAKTYGHTLEREIGYLTAHSMLHLLGYDHEEGGMARVRMRPITAPTGAHWRKSKSSWMRTPRSRWLLTCTAMISRSKTAEKCHSIGRLTGRNTPG